MLSCKVCVGLPWKNPGALIQHLSDKPIGGPDVPQRRYNELLACPKLLNEPTDKWKRAKAIIDQLTEELEKL